MNVPIILASTSRIRRQILAAAGVEFEIVRPDVDEVLITSKGLGDGLSLDAVTQRLADAKALAPKAPAEAIVVGSDQMLELGGRAHDKARTLAEARARLLEMQGGSHALINAVAAAREGRVVWRHLARSVIMMRRKTPAEIDAYLAACGEGVLASVACYEVEGLGSRLIERIEGDYFSVLGLSLFPLLGFLRAEGALPF
ncbi:MAG: Maf family protein [Parvularculaceae bacterium]|nr:Maf family protein [Parvularculaceae bacterium]